MSSTLAGKSGCQQPIPSRGSSRPAFSDISFLSHGLTIETNCSRGNSFVITEKRNNRFAHNPKDIERKSFGSSHANLFSCSSTTSLPVQSIIICALCTIAISTGVVGGNVLDNASIFA
ncbi:hypothetical protein ES703_100196 [subsurface metagenome]